MNITFRQIDAFRVVVSTGTVTEAATMLGISQPAVSRLISDLESEIGYRLFQRSGRLLSPTEEARLLVDEIRQAISGMEHIKEAAVAIGSFGHARLTLVTTPAFSTQLVPDLFGSFAKACPDAMARMEIEANDDTVEWMVSQRFDFGLTANEPANPSFQSLVLKSEGVYCVLPDTHPLVGKTAINAQDLAGESFISYMASSRFRFEIDQFFDAKGITRRLQYETRTTDAICRLVARGLGVAVVGSSASYLGAIPNCIALPFEAPLSFRSVMFWPKKRPLSAVAETFLEVAQRSVTAG